MMAFFFAIFRCLVCFVFALTVLYWALPSHWGMVLFKLRVLVSFAVFIVFGFITSVISLCRSWPSFSLSSPKPFAVF